jgi:hypothetical protein
MMKKREYNICMSKDAWIGIVGVAVVVLLGYAAYVLYPAQTPFVPTTNTPVAHDTPIAHSFGAVAAKTATEFTFKDQTGRILTVTLSDATKIVQGKTIKQWSDIKVGTIVSVMGNTITIIPPPPVPTAKQ